MNGIDNAKIRQGDTDEFYSLFKCLYPGLKATACRFVDRHTAEDLVQEVFMELWERREVTEIDNIGSFLCRCIQNKCLNHLKHRSVIEKYEAGIRIAQSRINHLNERRDKNEVLDRVIDLNIKERLENSISKLPPKCAEAFRLRFFDDMSYKQIAEVMNISPRTVEGHVQKATAFLKEDLKDIIVAFALFALGSSSF